MDSPAQEQLDQLQYEARNFKNIADGESYLKSNLSRWPSLLEKELRRFRNANWFIMNTKRGY